uniref:Uncharacterized protein n=1 Tax=Arundo donax TaxID=35708 RepID=A0A0A9L4D9_ARUDO
MRIQRQLLQQIRGLIRDRRSGRSRSSGGGSRSGSGSSGRVRGRRDGCHVGANKRDPNGRQRRDPRAPCRAFSSPFSPSDR